MSCKCGTLLHAPCIYLTRSEPAEQSQPSLTVRSAGNQAPSTTPEPFHFHFAHPAATSRPLSSRRC